jgi:hypothetical protein
MRYTPSPAKTQIVEKRINKPPFVAPGFGKYIGDDRAWQDR